MKRCQKNSILSQLARVYDPLGILSTALLERKSIFRTACDENKGVILGFLNPL